MAEECIQGCHLKAMGSLTNADRFPSPTEDRDKAKGLTFCGRVYLFIYRSRVD